MLLLLRIEVKGRDTPLALGIQQQVGEEVSSRVSACETTGCASWTGSTESFPATSFFVVSKHFRQSREDSDGKRESKTHQYAAQQPVRLVQTRDLWQSS
jgi:hypothetical protein